MAHSLQQRPADPRQRWAPCVCISRDTNSIDYVIATNAFGSTVYKSWRSMVVFESANSLQDLVQVAVAQSHLSYLTLTYWTTGELMIFPNNVSLQ